MQVTNQQRNTALNIGLIGLGAIVVYKVGGLVGLWETKADKDAAKWRKAAALTPSYYKITFKTNSILDVVKKIYTKADYPKLAEAVQSISNFYNSKGYFVDDEQAAVTWLTRTVTSKIELSIFVDMFENYPAIQKTGFLDYIKAYLTGNYASLIVPQQTGKNFLDYMDSFLENKYQAKLWNWYKELPILSPAQYAAYKKNTGRTLVITNEKK